MILLAKHDFLSFTSELSADWSHSVALSSIRYAICDLYNTPSFVSCSVALRSGPANGDLRLAYNNGSRYHGVLYIFLDGEWGSVSYQGFTKSAADVACRQLGQVRADNFTATGVNNTDLIPDDE